IRYPLVTGVQTCALPISRQRFQIGKHTAVLLGDIERAGSVEYHYIMAVFDENQQPCYFVASEVNSMVKTLGGGSHFLGLFDGDRSEERRVGKEGRSEDWE